MHRARQRSIRRVLGMRSNQPIGKLPHLRGRVEIATLGGHLHHGRRLRLHAVPARAAQRMVTLRVKALPA